MRIGICEKYHLSWEEAGETPIPEAWDLLAGYAETMQAERKEVEQRIFDGLTKEKQERYLTRIRLLEEQELGGTGKPHGG